MARRRRYSRLSLFYIVVLTSMLIGGSLWLDQRGQVVDAVVKSKQEEITGVGVLGMLAGYGWHAQR
jgi:hypothetical protein